MLEELVKRNRSYRRFHQDERIELKLLRRLVDLARHSASSANRQPLKYVLTVDPDTNQKVFETLKWAGYLKEWDGPGEGERPAAYIVILGDTTIHKTFSVDHGIAAQSILLGATEAGFGGCMVASIDQLKLKRVLALPEHLVVLLVVALGKPAEEVVVESVDSEGKIEYYRGPDGVHHVPKRPLGELVVGEFGS
ncbi:nitroreductase family protein [Gemmatimonadota bacterium]